MSGRYGFKDTRTGQVVRAYDKGCAVRACVSSRYVLVVWCGDEWRELFDGAPARPLAARRIGLRERLALRASRWPVLGRYVGMRADSVGAGVVFRRHNRSR